MLLSNIVALFFSFSTAYLIKKAIEDDYILQKLFFNNFDYFVEVYKYYLNNLYSDEDAEKMYNYIEFFNNKMIDFIKQNVLFLKNDTEPLEENIADELPEKIPEKYEDKYLEAYKKMDSVECSDEKIQGLKNTILMENTPLGNVIMYYDKTRETFIYYSDSTIPYRYLETISRKYVIMNNCKQIHVDMEEEIKEAQEKLEQKKQQEEEKKKQEQIDANIPVPNLTNFASITNIKKSVFAKLKKYNTNTSLKSSGIPTDNKSVSKKNIPESDKTFILKEKANRYSCEGKLMNFSFLKKVDKKIVDKRYAMNFSDFKKMIVPGIKK
jgi:hypothetical protein